VLDEANLLSAFSRADERDLRVPRHGARGTIVVNGMAGAASRFLGALTPEQRLQASLPFDGATSTATSGRISCVST